MHRMSFLIVTLTLTHSLVSVGKPQTRRTFLTKVSCATVALFAGDLALGTEQENSELGLHEYAAELRRLLLKLDPAGAHLHDAKIKEFRTKLWERLQEHLATMTGSLREVRISVVRSFALSNGQYLNVEASFEVEGTDRRIVSEEAHRKNELVVARLTSADRDDAGDIGLIYQVESKAKRAKYTFTLEPG